LRACGKPGSGLVRDFFDGPAVLCQSERAPRRQHEEPSFPFCSGFDEALGCKALEEILAHRPGEVRPVHHPRRQHGAPADSLQDVDHHLRPRTSPESIAPGRRVKREELGGVRVIEVLQSRLRERGADLTADGHSRAPNRLMGGVSDSGGRTESRTWQAEEARRGEVMRKPSSLGSGRSAS
jgi:hypothetical protein